MNQSTPWWQQRRWPWIVLGIAAALWSIAAQLERVRAQELFPRWVQLQAAEAAQRLRDTPAPMWPTVAWEHWGRAPGIDGLLVRDAADRVIWPAGAAAASVLSPCAPGLAAITTRCRWIVPVQDAQGASLATFEWQLDPAQWRGRAIMPWRWSALLLLAGAAGWFCWQRYRQRIATSAANVAAAASAQVNPRGHEGERPPTGLDWALGAADVLTQPVLVLDAQYRVVGANGSAYGAFSELRTVMGSHWYDIAERLPGSNRLLAALDTVGGNGPVSCYEPGNDTEPGIGAARLMAGDTCYGYWMALDVAR